MLNKRIFLFAITAMSCDGQFLNSFLPLVNVSKTPLATLTTRTSGDIITAAARVVSSGPTALTRALGVGNSLPILINNNNVVDVVNRYVVEYNIGLGNEDAHLPISSLIPKYGHPFEKHEVVTDDGYILTLHRIPGNGSVVFLMHGILCSSDDYVIAGPEDGLAYLLAREGYDVWMGNARGNKHSRRHIRLTPADGSFWDFSWHEIGTRDLPAMIDYVLEKTNQKTLKYIGHSQGTTSFFVLASERPEYNNKISLMIALSPVAFMSNVKSPIVRLLAPGTPVFHDAVKSFGLYELLPDNTVMRMLKLAMCGTGVLSEIMCSNVIFMFTGFGFRQLNFANLPVVLGHLPSGASAKQFTHFGQGVITRDFRKFDYGIAGNLQRYGAQVPPSYNVRNIAAPVALFYSDDDWLAHPTDVSTLHNRLQNTIDFHKIPYDQFNHLDFLFGKDFKSLVYSRVKRLMEQF